MGERPSFRDQALAKFRQALGEPEVLRSSSGDLYRWVLPRPHGLAMYVTLDSPERPDLAHIIVSDPKAGEVEPVVSINMRTLEEVALIVEKVIKQWKGGPGAK